MKFLRKTDLDAIKEVAESFVWLPFRYDGSVKEFLLMNHPYTQYTMVTIPALTLNLITEDAISTYRKYLLHQIHNIDSLYPLYLMIVEPYKTAFYKYILPYLSEHDAGMLLRDIYKSCDYINVDKNLSKFRLLQLFKHIDKKYYMYEEDTDFYDRLKTLDTDNHGIKIYRGSNAKTNHPMIDALSWTTNYDVARSFALRLTKDAGTIVSTTIHFDDIVACFESEYEIVIDYKKLNKFEISINTIVGEQEAV